MTAVRIAAADCTPDTIPLLVAWFAEHGIPDAELAVLIDAGREPVIRDGQLTCVRVVLGPHRTIDAAMNGEMLAQTITMPIARPLPDGIGTVIP